MPGKIPWTEKCGRLHTVHGVARVAKSQTRLSDFTSLLLLPRYKVADDLQVEPFLKSQSESTLITVKTLPGISAPFDRLIIRFLFFPVARRIPQSRHRSPQREDVSE